jgi:hypothetical protein
MAMELKLSVLVKIQALHEHNTINSKKILTPKAEYKYKFYFRHTADQINCSSHTPLLSFHNTMFTMV